jgi:hypothetical protein
MLLKELRGNFPVAIAVPQVAAGAAGGGAFTVPNNFQIVSAAMVWGAAITGVATNFFTISFFNRVAGAGTVQWGTAIAYSNGVNAVKATPVTVTLSSTASDLQPAAGDVLSVEITTSGTGLLAPGGTLMLTGRWR